MCLASAVLVAWAVFGQSTSAVPASPAFEVADVHVSARSSNPSVQPFDSSAYAANRMKGGFRTRGLLHAANGNHGGSHPDRLWSGCRPCDRRANVAGDGSIRRDRQGSGRRHSRSSEADVAGVTGGPLSARGPPRDEAPAGLCLGRGKAPATQRGEGLGRHRLPLQTSVSEWTEERSRHRIVYGLHVPERQHDGVCGRAAYDSLDLHRQRPGAGPDRIDRFVEFQHPMDRAGHARVRRPRGHLALRRGGQATRAQVGTARDAHARHRGRPCKPSRCMRWRRTSAT